MKHVTPEAAIKTAHKTKTQKLAEALLADRDRPASPARTTATDCALCGRGMVYKGRPYCHDRCAEYAGDGFPAPDPHFAPKAINVPLRSWTVVAGPPDVTVGSVHYAGVLDSHHPEAGHSRMKPTADGFKINCPGCHHEFESRGSRHCSAECRQRDRERQDNLKVIAEAGVEIALKRKCEVCGAVIPTWRKGRRVSSNTRFCSAGCGQKARKALPRPGWAFRTLKRAKSG